MISKILLTGATGFVGTNLRAYLEADIQNISKLCLRGKWDTGIAENTDCIIHLAGKAHDLKKTSQPEEYYQINFELTKQLYDVFLKSEAKKFIFISSVKAVADRVDGVLTEDVVPNPQTHYGKSKLMAEEYIRSQPLPAGKSYYILRPSMIHGPGNKGNLNLLYQLVAKGIPYPLAAFHNRRSFLSVENLCFIIKEILLRDDISGGVYHVADHEPLSSNDLIRILSQAIGKSPRLLKIPASLIKALAQVGDKIRLPLTSERLQKLTENYVVNTQKIKLALNKDLPLSARDGILLTARAFKNA